MLNIEEILRISNDMGIEVTDSTEGKHYVIVNDKGKIEFDVDMLKSLYTKHSSCKLDLQVSNNYSFSISGNPYYSSSYKDLYFSTPVSINESIIDAA